MFKKSLPFLLLAVTFSTLHAQTFVYAPNTGNNNVSVINTATNTVTATIPVGPSPIGIVVSPDGTTVFVTNQGNGTISIINPATNTVTGAITLQAPASPRELAITPDGSSLYVPDLNGNLQVVNTATNTVTAVIPIGGILVGSVAITPDGATAYVQSISQVTVIATATNTVVKVIPVPIGQFGPGITIAPSGNTVYVTGGFSGEVISEIATVNNMVVASIPDPNGPVGIAISPDGSSIYVGDQGVSNVRVFNAANNTAVTTINSPTFNEPAGMVFTPDGAFVYVVNFGGNDVDVIDTATNTVVATIPVGANGDDLGIVTLNAPFSAFAIDNLNISPQGFHEQGDFTLGANTPGIDLAHQPVTLTIGSFSLTIPAGSFRQVGGNMHFVFNGTVKGLSINFNLKANNGSSTAFQYVVNVNGVDLTGQPDPVTVGLKIGENTGTTTVEF